MLPGVEEALRVEDSLDLGVKLERARRPLLLQLAPLQPAEAVLPGDGATEAGREDEQLCGRDVGSSELVLVLW